MLGAAQRATARCPLSLQLSPAPPHMAGCSVWEAAAAGSLSPASGAAGPSRVRQVKATERAGSRSGNSPSREISRPGHSISQGLTYTGPVCLDPSIPQTDSLHRAGHYRSQALQAWAVQRAGPYTNPASQRTSFPPKLRCHRNGHYVQSPR